MFNPALFDLLFDKDNKEETYGGYEGKERAISKIQQALQNNRFYEAIEILEDFDHDEEITILLEKKYSTKTADDWIIFVKKLKKEYYEGKNNTL